MAKPGFTPVARTETFFCAGRRVELAEDGLRARASGKASSSQVVTTFMPALDQGERPGA